MDCFPANGKTAKIENAGWLIESKIERKKIKRGGFFLTRLIGNGRPKPLGAEGQCLLGRQQEHFVAFWIMVLISH
jgi:hypothetical protein